MHTRLYREEEGEAKAYADITLPDAIWPLIKRVKWEFALGSSRLARKHALPRNQLKATLKLGKAGYLLADVGIVENGDRQVVFEPDDIKLPPPGL